MLLAVAALAVAGVLIGLERDHDGCQEAARTAFLASNASGSQLQAAADDLVRACDDAEPLNRIALGLRVERPRVAARLARTAAARDPDSYVAWGILAVAAPPAEAAAAKRQAGALNPLSVVASP